MKQNNAILTAVLFILSCIAFLQSTEANLPDANLPAGNNPAPSGVLARPVRAQLLFDHAPLTAGILHDGSVPFANSTPFVVGTAISKADASTFTLNQGGVYTVSYTLRAQWLSSIPVRVVIEVNGSAIGDPAIPLLNGAPLADHLAFQATAGSTVQMVNVGETNVPILEAFVSINIEKVE